MENRVTTFIVNDDVTNFFLLYRKLVETSYYQIGIYTTYDSTQHQNLINQDLIKLFPKMVYIGPTALYNYYIELANFPHYIDLEKYNKNIINMNIMNHVTGYHLDEIFPRQKTIYSYPLQVDHNIFLNGANSINKKEMNIGLNLLDAKYDTDGVLIADLPSLLKGIPNSNKKINFYVFGFIAENKQIAYLNKLNTYISDYTVINCMDMDYSQQIGILLQLDLLVSGSYSWGILAYGMSTPTLLIYPYYLMDMKGNITNSGLRPNPYVELIDDEVSIQGKDIVKDLIIW